MKDKKALTQHAGHIDDKMTYFRNAQWKSPECPHEKPDPIAKYALPIGIAAMLLTTAAILTGDGYANHHKQTVQTPPAIHAPANPREVYRK